MTISDEKLFDPPPKGFWRRQFHPVATPAQTSFDVFFGMILPVICLIADPIVFRDGVRNGILRNYAIAAYTFIALQVVILAAWLVWRGKLGRWLGIMAGGLYGGAVFAFGLGLVMLPISIIGLIVYFIGVLGFTPFFTGFVYLRNARRCMKTLRAKTAISKPIVAVVLGLVLVTNVPFLANQTVTGVIDSAIRVIADPRSPQEFRAAIQRLQTLHDLVPQQVDTRFEYHFNQTNEQRRKDRLSEARQRVTGYGLWD